MATAPKKLTKAEQISLDHARQIKALDSRITALNNRYNWLNEAMQRSLLNSSIKKWVVTGVVMNGTVLVIFLGLLFIT